MEIQKITGKSTYGPVLFVYKIDVLDTLPEGSIKITKKNPDKWKISDIDADKYFLDILEISSGYKPRDFGQHITLREQHRPLSFDYLKKIVISDPQKENNSLFDAAYQSILTQIKTIGLEVSFKIRDYSLFDSFWKYYNDSNKLKMHFDLGGHKI